MKFKRLLLVICLFSYICSDYASASISSSVIIERVRLYYSELSLFAKYGDKDEGRTHRERIKNELIVDGNGLIFNDIEYSLNHRNQLDIKFDSYIISIFGNNKITSFVPQNIQTSLQSDNHWRATYLLSVANNSQKLYDIALEMLFNSEGKILTIQPKQQEAPKPKPEPKPVIKIEKKNKPIEQPKEAEFKITGVHISKVGKDGKDVSQYEKKFYGLRVEIYYTNLIAPKEISIDFKHVKNGMSGYSYTNSRRELPIGTSYSFVLDNYGEKMRNEGKYIFNFYDVVNIRRSSNKLLYSETFIPKK